MLAEEQNLFDYRVEQGVCDKYKTKQIKKTTEKLKQNKVNHFPAQKGRPIIDKISTQKILPSINTADQFLQILKQTPEKPSFSIQKQINDLTNDPLMMKVFKAFIEFFYQFPCLTFSPVERNRMIQQQLCPIKAPFLQFSDQIQKIKINQVFSHTDIKIPAMRQFILNQICFFTGRLVDPQVTEEIYRLIRIIYQSICQYTKQESQNKNLNILKNCKFSAFKMVNQQWNFDLNKTKQMAQQISRYLAQLIQNNHQSFPYLTYTFTKTQLSRKTLRHRIFQRHIKLFKQIVISILLKQIKINMPEQYNCHEQQILSQCNVQTFQLKRQKKNYPIQKQQYNLSQASFLNSFPLLNSKQASNTGNGQNLIPQDILNSQQQSAIEDNHFLLN